MGPMHLEILNPFNHLKSLNLSGNHLDNFTLQITSLEVSTLLYFVLILSVKLAVPKQSHSRKALCYSIYRYMLSINIVLSYTNFNASHIHTQEIFPNLTHSRAAHEFIAPQDKKKQLVFIGSPILAYSLL